MLADDGIWDGFMPELRAVARTKGWSCRQACNVALRFGVSWDKLLVVVLRLPKWIMVPPGRACLTLL